MYELWRVTFVPDKNDPSYPCKEDKVCEGLSYESAINILMEMYDLVNGKGKLEYFAIDAKTSLCISMYEAIAE